MKIRFLNLLLAALLVCSASSLSWAQNKQNQPAKPDATQAPGPTWSEWETLTPENEEFSVLMPKSPSTETAKFPYHKMELNSRLYMSSLPGGPVLAIASFSGIKSDPAAYSDFARFNSYVDAFKDFFPPKIRPGTVAKLTLAGSRPFRGHTGRQYKMTLGDLTGSVQAYTTRKRFYAIVSLNTKKDDALDEKFLSSFTLPEKVNQAATTAADTKLENSANDGNPANTQTNDRTPNKPDTQTEGVPNQALPEDNTEAGTTSSTAGTAKSPSQNSGTAPKAPISGGMLNGKAIYLPAPEMPPGEANGVVMVQVLVDEQGMVISARAISGPPNLHALAVNAARLARFSPTLLMGEAVKVSGTLSYNFVRSN